MKTEKQAKTTFYQKEEEVPAGECWLVRIEGRVQGVMFRESARRTAQPMGITGYVKNMPDGSVQVLACGDKGALERFTAWLRQGPPLANVDGLDWIASANKCPDSFVIL